MAQNKNFPFSVRDYAPPDQQAVTSLFRDGVLEHVYPAFFKALTHPDHVGVALSISMAGYVLGGSSYLLALAFGGAWAALVYFCCRDVYEGYMLRRLAADMAHVRANYLDSPDSALWVAEVGGGGGGEAQVVGVAAVLGRKAEEEEKFDDWNGGVLGGAADQDGHGELSQMVVVFSRRRRNLGSQLMLKALDFCKERGHARLVLDVSSPQTAAIALCRKFGFVQTASHSNTHANRWFSKLAGISVMRMEKVL